MKKITFMLFVLVIFTTSCSAKNEQPIRATESLVGYMVIENDKIYFDRVEIVTAEDTDRIKELGLSKQADMPSGYYIYNPAKEKEEYELTNETIYSFVDMNLLFVINKDGDRNYTTTKKEEFLQYLNSTYTDTPPAQKVPFFIQVKDGKVVSITEKFEFTI